MGKIIPRIPMIAGGVFVVLLLVWYVGFWSKINGQITTAQSTTSSIQAQIQQYQTEIAQIKTQPSTGPSDSEVSAEIAQIQTAIPAEPQLAQILDLVNQASMQSGVAYASISPTTPTAVTATSGSSSTATTVASAAGSSSAPAGAQSSTPQALQAVKLAINVSGRYFQVVSFIDQIDQLQRIFVITGITLNGGSSSASAAPDVLFSPILTVTIQAETFNFGTSTSTATGGSGSGSSVTVAPAVTTTTVPGTTTTTVPSSSTTAPSSTTSASVIPG